MGRLLGLPIAASAHASAIDHTIIAAHWFILVMLLGWSSYFLFVLVRFRSGRPRGRSSSLPTWLALALVIAVATVEATELVSTALPTWFDRMRTVPSPAESTVVRVVAEQFAWNIHYPGADGLFGRTVASLISAENPLGLDATDPAAADDLTTINQLNLPIGRPVLIYLSSKDVVHSFTLPQMRIKQDVVPGTTVTVSFEPTMESPSATGWEIVCSQLCGLGHYRMRGFYRIMSQAAFDAWFREEFELSHETVPPSRGAS